MVAHSKLARDFDVRQLAKETKNFSGAEIEGLVRAATSTAMNRLIKVMIQNRSFKRKKLPTNETIACGVGEAN